MDAWKDGEEFEELQVLEEEAEASEHLHVMMETIAKGEVKEKKKNMLYNLTVELEIPGVKKLYNLTVELEIPGVKKLSELHLMRVSSLLESPVQQ